jgi:hypothetical protein
MAEVPKTPPPAEAPKTSAEVLKSIPTGTIIWIILALLQAILFYSGAAKLSYDRFRSVGWAIVAFLFAPLYYMYYAFFVSTSASPVMIAAARRAWRM